MRTSACAVLYALIQLAQSTTAPQPPQSDSKPGSVIVPPSSVANPGDAGVRGHTNIEIVVPPDHSPAPPPSLQPPNAAR